MPYQTLCNSSLFGKWPPDREKREVTMTEEERQLVKFCAELQNLRDKNKLTSKTRMETIKRFPAGYNAWCRRGRPEVNHGSHSTLRVNVRGV
jgi:hypothetical protein